MRVKLLSDLIGPRGTICQAEIDGEWLLIWPPGRRQDDTVAFQMPDAPLLLSPEMAHGQLELVMGSPEDREELLLASFDSVVLG